MPDSLFMKLLKIGIMMALAMFLTNQESFAKVADVEFSEFVGDSDLIVVARVESIRTSLLGRRYANAQVLEVWKGEKMEAVTFRASGTWVCDISDARVGEVDLLFLFKERGARTYGIAHSGRGRLPLLKGARKDYAAWPHDVKLPSGLSRNSARAVSVASFRELVKGAARK